MGHQAAGRARAPIARAATPGRTRIGAALLAAWLLAGSVPATASAAPQGVGTDAQDGATGDTTDAAAAFTPAQRRAIVAILRRAMRDDPTILRDAVAALEASEARQQQVDAASALASNQTALTATAGDPELGHPDAPVTVVEFYDTRCPYCRRMLSTIDSLVKEDSQVRVVFKDIPILGPGSRLQARALLSALHLGGNAAYLRLQQAVMTDPAQPTTESLRADAIQAGLDPAAVLAGMDDPAVSARIEANIHLAQVLHVQGTPALVIGHRMVAGAVELADLETVVAEAAKGGR